MVKCPKCKADITSLRFSKEKFITGDLVFNEMGLEYQEEYDIFEEQKPYLYKCPECDEILFEDEIEAEEFLQKK